MAWTRDRKLDIAGVLLAVLLLIAVGVAVFGAIEASSDAESRPSAEFEVERINDTHATLVHAGGDTLAGDELVVTINGRERVVEFPEQVVQGTEVVLQVRADRTLRVYWTGDRGPRERIASART